MGKKDKILFSQNTISVLDVWNKMKKTVICLKWDSSRILHGPSRLFIKPNQKYISLYQFTYE